MNRNTTAQWIRGRNLCLAAAVAVVALVMVLAPSWAQYYPPYGGAPGKSLTWPPIAVSVSVTGGWIVVEGRTEDQAQRMVWRTPLARYTGQLAVEHGYGSMWVQSGRRQFVLDDATGQAVELKPGQVWRQTYGPLTQPYQPPEASSYTPGTQPAAVPAVPAPAVAPAPAEDAKAIARRQQALEAVFSANQQMLAALSRMDNMTCMRARGNASAEEVKEAGEAADRARAVLQQAQAKAIQEIAPELAPAAPAGAAAPATQPVVAVYTASPVPPAPAVQQAQSRVLDLMARYNQTQMDLAKQQQAGAKPEAMADAQKQAKELAAQLDSADTLLQRLRMVENMPPSGSISPQLQAKMEDTQKRVEDLLAVHHEAEAAALKAQDAFDKKQISSAELEAVHTKLVQTLRDLSAARRDLDNLRQSAIGESGRTATE